MTDQEKLAAYESMRAEVERRYAELLSTLERLKAEGRTKTVTYRENLGWKQYYRAILELYQKYGLSQT